MRQSDEASQNRAIAVLFDIAEDGDSSTDERLTAASTLLQHFEQLALHKGAGVQSAVIAEPIADPSEA